MLSGVTFFSLIPSSGPGLLATAGQLPWHAAMLFAQGEHAITRGPGGYFSWVKLLVIWLLFIVWVKTTDWVNQDTQRVGMPHQVWHPVIFFVFLAGLLAAISIPLFVVGGILLFICWIGPLGAYIGVRNSQVEPHRQVLTPDHLWFMTATLLNRMGMKVRAESRAAHEKGPPVDLRPMGATNDQANQANLISARQSIGFVTAKELLADVIHRRGEKVMLDYLNDHVSVRYQIDGVWHETDSQERENADNTLQVFKRLANLNIAERRARQEGMFGAKFEGQAITTKLVSQGTKTGERVILHLERAADAQFKTLLDLGMREKMQDQLKELLQRDHGLILLSAMPTGGLTTTLTFVLRNTDRFLNDYAGLQDASLPKLAVDNIDFVTYDSVAGQKPEEELVRLLRKDPDAVVMQEMPNAATVKLLCNAAAEDKIVITAIQSKEAVEALLRVLLLKVAPEDFAPAVIGVLNQRLVRKLCTTCKVAYKPAPDLLKKLGLPAGRIDAFYRNPDKPEKESEVCTDCDGLGYKGRTSFFELLVITDEMRQALLKQPKLENLRALAKKVGHRSLQDEGIVLVAKGVTSLNELQRVLKT